MSVSERLSPYLASPFSPCPTHTVYQGSPATLMAGARILLLLEIFVRKFISDGKRRAGISGSGQAKSDHATNFYDLLHAAPLLLY